MEAYLIKTFAHGLLGMTVGKRCRVGDRDATVRVWTREHCCKAAHRGYGLAKLISRQN
jgi:hypothetical protein